MIGYNCRQCDNCGAFALESYLYCPNCGKPLPPASQLKKKICPMCQGTGEVVDWGGPVMNNRGNYD